MRGADLANTAKAFQSAYTAQGSGSPKVVDTSGQIKIDENSGGVGPHKIEYYHANQNGKCFGDLEVYNGVKPLVINGTTHDGRSLTNLDLTQFRWDYSKDSTFEKATDFGTCPDAYTKTGSDGRHAASIPESKREFWVYAKDTYVDSQNLKTIDLKFTFYKLQMNTKGEYMETDSSNHQPYEVVTQVDYKKTPITSTVKDDPVAFSKLKVVKYATKVNDQPLEKSREPQSATVTPGTNGRELDAPKSGDPVPVKTGDKIEYTIRVYNIGNADFKGESRDNSTGKDRYITDDYMNSNEGMVCVGTGVVNQSQFRKNGWSYDNTTRKAQYDVSAIKEIAKCTDMNNPSYVDLTITFEVKAAGNFDVIKNVITNVPGKRPDEKDPEEDIYIGYVKIQGKVWQDERLGKNTTGNALYDQGTDKLMSGIRVELINANTHEVATNNEIQNETTNIKPITDETKQYISLMNTRSIRAQVVTGTERNI